MPTLLLAAVGRVILDRGDDIVAIGALVILAGCALALPVLWLHGRRIRRP